MGGRKRSQEPEAGSDVEASEQELTATRKELREAEAVADAGVARGEELERMAREQQESAERIRQKARAPTGPLTPAPEPTEEEPED